jgi:hypothetical protein
MLKINLAKTELVLIGNVRNVNGLTIMSYRVCLSPPEILGPPSRCSIQG